MVEPDVTVPLVEPLFETFRVLSARLQVMLGGLFSLYLIYVMYTFVRERKQIQLLKRIDRKLTKVEERLDQLEGKKKKKRK
jgi:hypothetical protein